MIASHLLARHHRLALAAASTVAIGGLGLAFVAGAGPAQAAATDPPLGTTDRFAVLAGSGITNTGTTTIAGDIGSDPTPTITGQNSIVMTSGTIRDTADDPVVQQAKTDLVTAYNAAAAATPEAPAPPALSGELGGTILKPGVHTRAGTLGLTGTVTLDGEGVGSSVFIIQVSSDMTTATDSRVLLINGAQPCHVYWQVDGSVTFGTRTSFVGNVLAMTSISAVTNATFDGRLLARNGAVTLQSNTITRSACVAPTTSTPATPTASTATPGTPSSSTPTPGGVVPSSTPSAPRATSPTDGPGDRADDDEDGSDGDGDSTSGSDAAGDADSGSDADGPTTDTGLPDAGGPAGILVPLGLVGVVAGTGIVLAARRRKGMHRA